MQPTAVEVCDIAVIGGGPAAAAASRMLALYGYHVVVLTGPRHDRSGRPPLAESLPPSCRKPLTALGLTDVVAGAGFLGATGNTVAWGGGELLPQRFAAGDTGLQVVRDRLDAVLLGEARAAGAELREGASARGVEVLDEAGGAASHRIDWTGSPGSRSGRLLARWVLDCSGRSGVLARRGLRRRERQPGTTALVGVWCRPGGWPLEDDSHTLVESYLDGWCWSVPVAPGVRYVAAMIDPQASPPARGAGLAAMYRAELAKTRHLRRLLADAAPAAAPWACTATPYHARRCAGERFLLVGDAASFLDPLSSFGVKKALASGWLAAIVVHTCLTDPAMAEAARTFYEEREREAYTQQQELAASQYARAAEHYDHPFWRVRARAAAGGAAGAARRSDDHGDPAIPGAPGVLRAAAPFDSMSIAPASEEVPLQPGLSPIVAGSSAPADARGPEALGSRFGARLAAALAGLRQRDRLRLGPGPRLQRLQRPAVRNRFIVLEEHLASPAAPAGLRYLWGVELPALLELGPRHERVPDLFEAYNRCRPPVLLTDFMAALSALVALEMLQHEDQPPT